MKGGGVRQPADAHEQEDVAVQGSGNGGRRSVVLIEEAL